MRILVTISAILLFAVFYGLYVSASYLQIRFDSPQQLFNIRDTAIVTFTSILVILTGTVSESKTERAWLRTGWLYLLLICWWRVLYYYHLLPVINLWYLIWFNLGTAIASFFSFFYIIKYKIHIEPRHE